MFKKSFWGWEGGWFTELANFCGVNTTTRAHFRLPPWFHRIGNQEEKYSDLSSLRKPVPVPIPSHSRQIIGYWTAFFKKKKSWSTISQLSFSLFEWDRQVESQNWVLPDHGGEFMLRWGTRQRQRSGRRKGERKLILREEIRAELRCLKGIALAFATRYAMSLWGGHSGKESACQCRRCKKRVFDPWDKKISWRKKWQPTPLCLPGKSHGQRILVGYSPWDYKGTQPSTHTHQYRHTCDVTLLPHLLQKIFSKTLSLHHR